MKVSIAPEKIDNKTGLPIPNPNALVQVTKGAIKGLGPIALDVTNQRIFYVADSNQKGGPPGLSFTYFNGTGDFQLTEASGINAIYFSNNKVFYLVNHAQVYFQKVYTKLPKVDPILLSDKFFSNANGITVIDDFVYVTDAKLGLLVLKRYDDFKPSDTPDKVKTDLITNLRGLTVLRSSASYIYMGAVTLLTLFAAFY